MHLACTFRPDGESLKKTELFVRGVEVAREVELDIGHYCTALTLLRWDKCEHGRERTVGKKGEVMFRRLVPLGGANLPLNHPVERLSIHAHQSCRTGLVAAHGAQDSQQITRLQLLERWKVAFGDDVGHNR